MSAGSQVNPIDVEECTSVDTQSTEPLIWSVSSDYDSDINSWNSQEDDSDDYEADSDFEPSDEVEIDSMVVDSDDD